MIVRGPGKKNRVWIKLNVFALGSWSKSVQVVSAWSYPNPPTPAAVEMVITRIGMIQAVDIITKSTTGEYILRYIAGRVISIILFNAIPDRLYKPTPKHVSKRKAPNSQNHSCPGRAHPLCPYNAMIFGINPTLDNKSAMVKDTTNTLVRVCNFLLRHTAKMMRLLLLMPQIDISSSIVATNIFSEYDKNGCSAVELNSDVFIIL